MLRFTSIPTALLALTIGTAAAQDAPPPQAPDMSELVQAYRNGDYATARAGLERLAPTAGPVAEYRLGRILVEGRGGPRDMARGAEWLQSAAQKGNADAALLLAQILLGAQEGAVDTARAARLLRQAATLGLTAAQVELGLLLASDQLGPPDHDAAFDWMMAAAQSDSAEAQIWLAQAFATGRGTAQDPEQAVIWLTRAAENGSAQAQLRMGMQADSDGDTPGAINWYRRAADQGLPLAQRILGSKYFYADGIDQNREEGLRWLKTAAAAGEPGAQMNLALDALDQGDDAAAAALFQRAADQGLLRAQVALGDLYRLGRGVEADQRIAEGYYFDAHRAGYGAGTIRLGQLVVANGLTRTIRPQAAADFALAAARAGDSRATDWLSDQADAGNAAATARLALTLDVPTTDPDRVALLKRAARAGDALGQAYLGAALVDGEGAAPDFVEGYAWLNIAAARGIDTAIRQRDAIAQLLPAQDLARAQARTRTLLQQIDAAVVPSSPPGGQAPE